MSTGLTTTNFTIQKIDKASVDSVKNAIFQRVVSKSTGTEEAVVNNNKEYNTESIKVGFQNELMSEARKSVSNNMNPFSNNMFQATQAAASTNISEVQVSTSKVKAGGQTQQSTTTKKIHTRIAQSTALQNGMLSSAIRESAMVEAREQMTANNTLMSRLQFLNTQNAINAYPSAKFA